MGEILVFGAKIASKKDKGVKNMQLIINGETKEFRDGISLLDVLKQLSLEDKVMAAAVNMEIVKQDSWNDFQPKEGDRLELLDFVGGG